MTDSLSELINDLVKEGFMDGELSVERNVITITLDNDVPEKIKAKYHTDGVSKDGGFNKAPPLSSG